MLGSSSRRSKLSCLACQPLHHKLWLDFLASGSRQGRLLATCEGEIARCIYQHSLHPSTPRAHFINQPAEYSPRGSWRSSLLTIIHIHPSGHNSTRLLVRSLAFTLALSDILQLPRRSTDTTLLLITCPFYHCQQTFPRHSPDLFTSTEAYCR